MYNNNLKSPFDKVPINKRVTRNEYNKNRNNNKNKNKNKYESGSESESSNNGSVCSVSLSQFKLQKPQKTDVLNEFRYDNEPIKTKSKRGKKTFENPSDLLSDMGCDANSFRRKLKKNSKKSVSKYKRKS
eukprot:809517_1